MQVFFVEQASKISFLKSIFKNIEQIEDKIIVNEDVKKSNLKQKIKIIKKILKISELDALIIEKKLKNNKEFMNLLYSNDINIINRKVFI